jgi:prepilin-type processing-associated H-X9-DG protein
MVRRSPVHSTAFTCVELIVVIAIFTLLISILLPIMGKARESSNAIRCAANLRAVGESLQSYTIASNGFLPPSYTQDPDKRYIHWSGLLLHLNLAGSDTFTCPSFDYGGLPPTNPAPDNFDPAQISETPGVIDLQAPRIAFTLNEALARARASDVSNPSRTILASEFVRDWRVISDAPPAGPAVSRSHRAVHAPSRLHWIGRNHNAGAQTNFLYLDGHVETRSLSQTLAASEWDSRSGIAASQ